LWGWDTLWNMVSKLLELFIASSESETIHPGGRHVMDKAVYGPGQLGKEPSSPISRDWAKRTERMIQSSREGS
jgi:hypothetical protein